MDQRPIIDEVHEYEVEALRKFYKTAQNVIRSNEQLLKILLESKLPLAEKSGLQQILELKSDD